MSGREGDVMGVKQLIEQARYHPAASLPTETHQSYPIPVKRDNKLKIIFLYSPGHLTMKEGFQLLAPYYMACLDAKTGKFEEMRMIMPSDLGQTHAEGEVIGKYMLPAGMNQEQFLSAQAELYRLYDLLLPEFSRDAMLLSEPIRDAAHDFLRIFTKIGEPPLQPYYRRVGRDFFDWVERSRRKI